MHAVLDTHDDAIRQRTILMVYFSLGDQYALGHAVDVVDRYPELIEGRVSEEAAEALKSMKCDTDVLVPVLSRD